MKTPISRGKRIALAITMLVLFLVAAFFCLIGFIGPLLIIGSGNPNAGTWEDDSNNWFRAFNEAQPANVTVIHSKYWKSNHFTDEYIYFFEVTASPEWRKEYLNKRNFTLIAPSNAWSFRSSVGCDLTPDWFAPDPVEQYDVWDLPAYHGRVWINQTNEHMHFEGSQL
jgi:hypothetical protein